MAAERVLLVEDNPMNMELATDLLEAAGYEVVQAWSGEDAVKQAHAVGPAAILMDISLPGMDGLTATRLIKCNPLTHDIPVMALTAHAMKGDEDRALEVGCDGYITKPIDTKSFAETVERLISTGKGPSRT